MAVDRPTIRRIQLNEGAHGDSSTILETSIEYGYGILVYTSSEGLGKEGLLFHYSPSDILQEFHAELKFLIHDHQTMKHSEVKKAEILYHTLDRNLDLIELGLKQIVGKGIEVGKKQYRIDTDHYSKIKSEDGRLYFNVGDAFWGITGDLNGKFE